MEKEALIKVRCDASEVTEAEKKVERLTELLREANTLMDELASKKVNFAARRARIFKRLLTLHFTD